MEESIIVAVDDLESTQVQVGAPVVFLGHKVETSPLKEVEEAHQG